MDVKHEAEITKKNIMAIKAYTEFTRNKTNEQQKELENAKNSIAALKAEMEILKSQMQTLQVKIYSGGSTGGN